MKYADTVRGVLEEWFEDMEALLSRSFVDSIEEARTDYRKGEVKRLEDILN